MALVAVTSPGDSPGVTTAALAWSLMWPAEVLLAECSPYGGRVMRGYLRNNVPGGRGLWELALASAQDPASARRSLWQQTITLAEAPRRMLLAGLTEPGQATQLTAQTWGTLAELLASSAFDVLADVGALTLETPFPLLASADLVMFVMRPTLAQVTVAIPRLARLRESLQDVPLGLCLIGEAKTANGLYYEEAAVRRHLGGDFALVVRLPEDPRSALRLSDGIGGAKRLESMRLLSESRRIAAILRRHCERPAQPAGPQAPPHWGGRA